MLVSNIIVTRNRREILYVHLLAITRQTMGLDDYEVIVVVDGSEDGTLAMVQALDVPYRKVVLCTKKAGVAMARNAGLEHARGDIVIFHDDDYIPWPENFASFAPFVVAGWAAVGYISQEHAARIRPGHAYRDWIGCNCAAWREDIAAAGGFDENLVGWTFEDIDLALRLHAAGVGFSYISHASGIHLWPTGKSSAAKWAEHARNRAYLVAKHPAFADIF